jgi:hypothetical protein
VIRTPSAPGIANLQPRGVTKVERLNRHRSDTEQSRRFVMTPDWGRRVPGLTLPEAEIPELKNPRLEARRKVKEARTKQEAESKEKQEVKEAVLAPTLPAGQPKMRGVNVLLTVLAILGCVHIMVMMGIELNRMVASQQEIQRLTAETLVLEQQVAGLQSVVDDANNPEFREQLARGAGFAYPDEARWLRLPAKTQTTDQP